MTDTRASLTFPQKFKLAALIQENTEPDGEKFIRYTNGMTDEKIAALAAEQSGHPVTAHNVAAIRKEVVGRLNRGQGAPGRNKGVRADVEALRAEVAELRDALAAIGVPMRIAAQ
jgi:hypothetical protein